MQFKKRYVVVVVLLLLGLTTFTFASPRQVEKQKTSKGISERVSSDNNNSAFPGLKQIALVEIDGYGII